MTDIVTTNQQTIIVNGKNYNSIDEVPEEFRKLLKDDNNNNLPDFIENQIAKTKVNPVINTNYSEDWGRQKQGQSSNSFLSTFIKIIEVLTALVFLFIAVRSLK